MATEVGVDGATLRDAIRSLGLAGSAVCVHSSLRSFGHLIGGADALLDTFLDEDCTVLVPAFSWEAFAVPAPAGSRPNRNGTDYSWDPSPTSCRPFSISSREIDLDEMGRLPAAVLDRDLAVRGDHPLCSFAAIGAEAAALVTGQTWSDVYAPLRVLAERGGHVLLIGVDLTAMTMLHLAECDAGREPFRRWAKRDEDAVQAVPVGGCSDGFNQLDRKLRACRRARTVGPSHWAAYGASRTLARATDVIRRDPDITVCGARCERCLDARGGGPIIPTP